MSEQGTSSFSKVVCYSVFALAILNLVVFVVVALSIGGFAGSGKTVDSRYYVGSHGVYTDVSRTVFRYSQIHYYGIWFTNCLALLVGGAYELERRHAKRVTKDSANIKQPSDD